ncbi:MULTISPECIES: septal ring lytic transglycosylase RlpA family protein [unclassified Carboxylicivirga]|uniref:septal ring lytic transglycosylase RlpA family protein n=1 Tax=Carboxylicivirga TaxID=1628153 RepID=UPI003D33DE51
MLTIVFCEASAQKFQQEGLASYYANKFEGRPTASGEPFSNHKLTAAHPTLPFGTRLKVTNLSNQKTVVVTINDRGPFVKNRIIDLSQRAARELGFLQAGLCRVRIEKVMSENKKTAPPNKLKSKDATLENHKISPHITLPKKQEKHTSK